MESIKIQTIILGLCFCSWVGALPNWVTPNSQVLSILDRELSTKTGDYFKRTVRRAGNQTIELEGFASLSGTIDNYYRVVKDVPGYRKWILAGVNQKPSGGDYLLQVLDLKPTPNFNVLQAEFGLHFPGIKQRVYRSFKVLPERSSESVVVTCESLEANDLLLKSMTGFVSAFSDPKNKERLWVYFKGFARLRSWLLYQALPDKLLVRESSERIRTVLDNVGAEEVKQYSLNDDSNGVKAPQKKGKR